MILLGDIEVFLSCIGTKIPNADILKAITIIASEFNISETNFCGESLSYWEFFKRGVTFRFNENQILDTVFLYIIKNEEYHPYPFLEDLIRGINHKSMKQSVVDLFGIPERENVRWIKYRILDKYLHFEFDESSKLKQITIGQFHK